VDPRPERGGNATIVCDGKGGYEPQLNAWAGAPGGVEACVIGHEQSHARDWAARYPDGCVGADGKPRPEGSDIPLGGRRYPEFLRQSECRAYTGEVKCEEAALRTARPADRAFVQAILDDTRHQQAAACSPRPR
jgi:hypothetical protein